MTDDWVRSPASTRSGPRQDTPRLMVLVSGMLVYVASYDLASKIIAECADPERVDGAVTERLAELTPDEYRCDP